MKHHKEFFAILLLTILISACTTRHNVEVENQDFDLDAYPINKESSQSINLPPSLKIPTPSTAAAVVYGTLRSLSQNRAAYIAPSLYLGNINISESEEDDGVFLGSISIEEDPVAMQAMNGDFVFIDVPPGNYGLFIWTPVSAFIIENQETSKPIIIEVATGESYNLGTILVP